MTEARSAGLRRDWAWYGWGEPDRDRSLPEATLAMLHERVGDTRLTPPGEVSELAIPPAMAIPDSILAAAGTAGSSVEHEDRVRHALGKSYPDLVRLRSGSLEAAPDAVVAPAGAAETAAVLSACANAGVAVIPYGGGTSVVGGLEPLRGAYDRAISLDTVRMREVELDRTSLTARLGAGLRGPEAEAALAHLGYTVGHFPQSFRYATVGGFAATRSAGQASSGYGRFDELVTAVTLVTPRGELRTLETPHTAAGPSLRELIVGSEGLFGVITDVTVRVRPLPPRRHYEAWMAPDFASGAEIFRTLAQKGELPDVLRLSDEQETAVALASAGAGGLARSAFDAYLRLRGRSDGCMVICGFEGEPADVERRRNGTARSLRSGGAIPLGTRVGASWEHGRYDGPYLRDALLNLGVMADTLETSHTWSRLGELYTAVGGAIEGSLAAGGTPPIVLCHISHVYRDGASLYFTFIARQQEGEELQQWRAVKSAASMAIAATGGTITHHHAVGTDHAPYMRDEIGELGLEAMRAVKDTLDPAGIMNPGKFWPA